MCISCIMCIYICISFIYYIYMCVHTYTYAYSLGEDFESDHCHHQFLRHNISQWHGHRPLRHGTPRLCPARNKESGANSLLEASTVRRHCRLDLKSHICRKYQEPSDLAIMSACLNLCILLSECNPKREKGKSLPFPSKIVANTCLSVWACGKPIWNWIFGKHAWPFYFSPSDICMSTSFVHTGFPGCATGDPNMKLQTDGAGRRIIWT